MLLCDADFLPADQTVRLDRTRSPYEVGLDWLVDLSKPCFNGRQALIEEKKNGSRYNFVKLDIDGNKPAYDSFIMLKRRDDDRTRDVGHVVAFGKGKYRVGVARMRRTARSARSFSPKSTISAN